MKHVFKSWPGIAKALCLSSIILFLDCDGTLAPIAPAPDKARVPSKTKHILKQIAGIKSVKIAVISGRSLKSVKRLVGVPGIIYSGNHGFQIEGPKIKHSPNLLKYAHAVKEIKRALIRRLKGIKGVLIEDKGITLSVHYRRAPASRQRLVKTIFHEIVNSHPEKNKIMVKPGKKVFEVKPALDWNKGSVVLRLCGKNLPIYIGDDITDEDAFRVLKNKGITVFVGSSRRSLAQYYLKNTQEVYGFLKRIYSLKRG